MNNSHIIPTTLRLNVFFSCLTSLTCCQHSLCFFLTLPLTCYWLLSWLWLPSCLRKISHNTTLLLPLYCLSDDLYVLCIVIGASHIRPPLHLTCFLSQSNLDCCLLAYGSSISLSSSNSCAGKHQCGGCL